MKWLINALRRPYPYLLIILIGSVFKVTQIYQSYYWADEVATIFHVNGQDGSNFYTFPATEGPRPSADYLQQLRLSNRPDNALSEQWGRLARKPQFTPLHYAYLAIWYRLFGDSPFSYRWFSFFCYGLVLVVLYFLGHELVGAPPGGWLSAALFAVSPFFHFSAAHTRYPILFILSLFLAHLLLLYALRTGRKGWWVAYGLAIAHCLYVSFFGLLVLGAHRLFVLWKRRADWKPFVLSSGAAVVLYIPWLLLLWNNYGELHQALEWHKIMRLPFLEIVFWQLTHISTIIVDLWGETSLGLYFRGFVEPIYSQILGTSLLTIIPLAYIVYHLIKKGSATAKGLLLPLLAVGSLFFVVHDLYRESFLSALSHYQLILTTTTFLILAFFFAGKIKAGSAPVAILFLLSVGLGVFSISQQVRNRCITMRGDCSKNIAIARFLEAPGKKLLITTFSNNANYQVDNVISVLNESEAEDLDLFNVAQAPDIDSLFATGEYDHVYVFETDPDIEAAWKEKYGNRMVGKFSDFRSTFWELSPR